MQNFIYNINTELHFGKDMLDTLPTKIKEHTNKTILMTYGGGSIKSSGLYDKVVDLLNDNNIKFIELSGIKPNPEVSTAREGIRLIKEHDIDFILAVGGGSVIDNSKHMAIGSATDSDVWDIITQKEGVVIDPNKVAKLGTIITIAATGSEMNFGGVMSNPDLNMKMGYLNPLMRPVFTYEDPTQLETLPIYQRRAGLCDILSHLIEQYFSSHHDDGIEDRLAEGIMKNTITHASHYLNGNDYNTLANIFWSSSLALNYLVSLSRGGADWLSHMMEHEISAFTDLTHGIGLAIVQPKITKYYYEKDVREGKPLTKYENLGVAVFELNRDDENLAKKTVERLAELFKLISGVEYLEDVGITELDDGLIAERTLANNRSTYHRLTLDETKEVVANLYKKNN